MLMLANCKYVRRLFYENEWCYCEIDAIRRIRSVRTNGMWIGGYAHIEYALQALCGDLNRLRRFNDAVFSLAYWFLNLTCTVKQNCACFEFAKKVIWMAPKRNREKKRTNQNENDDGKKVLKKVTHISSVIIHYNFFDLSTVENSFFDSIKQKCLNLGVFSVLSLREMRCFEPFDETVCFFVVWIVDFSCARQHAYINFTIILIHASLF